MARPRGLIRSERLFVRVTPEEKAALLELSSKAGVSLTGFLLGCALGDSLGKSIVEKKSGSTKK